MSPILQAAFWGALAALPLLIGAWYALKRCPKDRTVGLVAAFGAGALVSAVSFELVEDAFAKSTPISLGVALALGAFTYYAGDRYLDRASGQTQGDSARGLALLMGAALDGIPESFILGLSLSAGAGISVSFFVAVVVSNFPEGMASAAELGNGQGVSKRRVLLMWSAVVGVSAIAAAAGAALAATTSSTGASAQAFAAGALLTMLVDDLIPEARRKGGISAGLVGVLGFAVAFGLHQIGA